MAAVHTALLLLQSRPHMHICIAQNHYHHHHHHFDVCFPGEPGLASSPLVPFLFLFWKRTSSDKWQVFTGRMPFLSANEQCHSTKGTHIYIRFNEKITWNVAFTYTCPLYMSKNNTDITAVTTHTTVNEAPDFRTFCAMQYETRCITCAANPKMLGRHLTLRNGMEFTCIVGLIYVKTVKVV